jgi:hypothetical protein
MALNKYITVMVIALVTFVSAQIGPVQEIDRVPRIHNKSLPFYDQIGEECNFFIELGLVKAPWPAECRVYQHTDGCNKYEISRDGKGVDSCQLEKNCNFKSVTPTCFEYFPAVNRTEQRFPEGGK